MTVRLTYGLTALTSLAAAALLADKLITTAVRKPPPGYWNSRAGRRAYEAAYNDAMAELPPPTRAHDVRTEFGFVRVYEWTAGEEKQGAAAPVVMVPGIRSGVPMWSENLPYWIGERTIYAMDALGDAGMSVHTVPFESFDSQPEWIEQTMAALEIPRAHMLGHSFGGALAAHHALRHPERVSSLTLLEPVMVLQPLSFSALLWSSMMILPLPQTWKDRALAEIGGVSVDEVRERTPVSDMVAQGANHYASITLTPKTLTDAEWQSMRMPIRIEIASDKSLAGGPKATERARRLGIGTVIMRPDTTHSLPLQAAEALGAELPAYWMNKDG